MNKLLFIGGPLVLFTCFSLYSDLITFGDQHPGVMHIGGVEPGATFSLTHEETYYCDENGNNCVLVEEKTELSEIEGLELEETPIEYRDGLGGDYNKTKQPGLAKYANIHLRRGSEFDFDWKAWRFTFEREAEIERINEEYDQKIKEAQQEPE